MTTPKAEANKPSFYLVFNLDYEGMLDDCNFENTIQNCKGWQYAVPIYVNNKNPHAKILTGVQVN